MAIALDWIKGKQEIFDHVARHLLTQNEKCTNEDGSSCRYRVRENDVVTACAAGCLIPEEHYNSSLEGKGWRNIYNPTHYANYEGIRKFVDATKWNEEEHTLITNLQTVHDSSPPERWRDSLIWLAGKHRLMYYVCGGPGCSTTV